MLILFDIELFWKWAASCEGPTHKIRLKKSSLGVEIHQKIMPSEGSRAMTISLSSCSLVLRPLSQYCSQLHLPSNCKHCEGFIWKTELAVLMLCDNVDNHGRWQIQTKRRHFENDILSGPKNPFPNIFFCAVWWFGHLRASFGCVDIASEGTEMGRLKSVPIWWKGESTSPPVAYLEAWLAHITMGLERCRREQAEERENWHQDPVWMRYSYKCQYKHRCTLCYLDEHVWRHS